MYPLRKCQKLLMVNYYTIFGKIISISMFNRGPILSYAIV